MNYSDRVRGPGGRCARSESWSRGCVLLRAGVGAAVLLIASGNALAAGWHRPVIERLGLYSSPEFTRDDGYQTSIGNTPIAGTWIQGESTRYNGGPAELGKASWIWTAAAGTVRVGLFTGPEYTRSSGEQSTSLGAFSIPAGRFVGYSERYLGGTASKGIAAWTWTGHEGTQRIGLHGGSEFTRNDGFQNTYSDSVNGAGRIAGDSTRYNGGPSSLGNATWTWDSTNGTVRIGLHGTPEFTSSAGEQWSFRRGMTSAGVVGGYSTRYNSSANPTGQASWAWREGAGTARIGLFGGSEFTSLQGDQFASITSMNAAGRIVGVSTRYSGLSALGGATTGQASWAWDATLGTVRTGLIGPGYERGDGFVQSETVGLEQSGRVRGISQRYSGSQSLGQATWVWDPASGTVRTGLHGSSEFTRADGFEHSTYHPTLSGVPSLMLGISRRYSGSTQIGQAAWAWSPDGGAVRIGLVDAAEFTRADGTQNAILHGSNGAGLVTGSSVRYLSGGPVNGSGTATWAWDPTIGTVRTGLFSTPEFTAIDGFQRNSNSILTASGRVCGDTTRFNGGSLGLGLATWTWDAVNGTVRTGLFAGPEFTSSDGTQNSNLGGANVSGVVTGRSTRYNDGPDAQGVATWAWTQGAGTVRTGFFDAAHTSDTGVQNSAQLQLLTSGLVLGSSDRYLGGATLLGQSVWAFDPEGLVTIPLVFSVAEDGRASTSILRVAPNEWVLGSYDLYSGNSAVSTNAFIWSLGRGFADLGAIVDGGLTANGWSNLFSTYGADGVELVMGHGRLLGAHAETQAVFALRGIPGPGSVGLLALAGLSSAARRRRLA